MSGMSSLILYQKTLKDLEPTRKRHSPDSRERQRMHWKLPFPGWVLDGYYHPFKTFRILFSKPGIGLPVIGQALCQSV